MNKEIDRTLLEIEKENKRKYQVQVNKKEFLQKRLVRYFEE